MKRYYWIGIAIGVGIFFAVFLGWKYGLFSAPGRNSPGDLPASPIETATSSVVSAPPGWSAYRNARYHFALFYPNGLEIRAYEEKGSASTITFQDEKRGIGFQIFVVPYGESQVSQERFLLDEPSGVREEPITVSVDGAVGAAFYGKDVRLGDTREVWFIKDGILYELTAPRSESDWLQGIIDTWKFI
jgi:hypothetical protein